jgi:hypothetical protein
MPSAWDACSPSANAIPEESSDLPVTRGPAPAVQRWHCRDVDFSGERWTGVLSPLNDPAYFAEVTVDHEAGTIVWPGGIDLAPEPLYEQAKAHPLLAA